MYDGWGWRPYVSVAERRRKAMMKLDQLRKKGKPVSPVTIEGRTIARTFWGKAWCENLERYSDFSNRLPRGRAYVRNGSVIDLRISPGKINALVSGSDIYKVAINVIPVSRQRWKSMCADCAGSIDSLVELLQGRFSKGVMERMCRQNSGLFPSPKEIELSCSCPDWAEMCKHVAAVLYGIGARLDQQPELFFRLHNVDEEDLIAKAGHALPLASKEPAAKDVLSGGEDLAELFGLDMAQSTGESGNVPGLAPQPTPAAETRATKQRRAKKARSKNRVKATAKKASASAKLSKAASKRIAAMMKKRWAKLKD